MDPGGTLRYENRPVLESILAYGQETRVPDHDVCRLSYYLKCCVVGCGMVVDDDDDAPLSFLNPIFLDYARAHLLPEILQATIRRLAFGQLSLGKLLHTAIILDEQHEVLPLGFLNSFYELKTAATHFTIRSFTDVTTGKQVHVHKIMICTFAWLQEYFLDPFIREYQTTTLLMALLRSSPSYSSSTTTTSPTMAMGNFSSSSLSGTSSATGSGGSCAVAAGHPQERTSVERLLDLIISSTLQQQQQLHLPQLYIQNPGMQPGLVAAAGAAVAAAAGALGAANAQAAAAQEDAEAAGPGAVIPPEAVLIQPLHAERDALIPDVPMAVAVLIPDDDDDDDEGNDVVYHSDGDHDEDGMDEDDDLYSTRRKSPR